MSKLKRQAQMERVKTCNELVKFISSCGRRFFYCKSTGQIGYFVLLKKLWWIDDYTGRAIYPYRCTDTQYFSHGGGLWAFVNEMRHFIITGEKKNEGCLDHNYWGYPEKDMEQIREKARKLGYVN